MCVQHDTITTPCQRQRELCGPLPKGGYYWLPLGIPGLSPPRGVSRKLGETEFCWFPRRRGRGLLLGYVLSIHGKKHVMGRRVMIHYRTCGDSRNLLLETGNSRLDPSNRGTQPWYTLLCRGYPPFRMSHKTPGNAISGWMIASDPDEANGERSLVGRCIGGPGRKNNFCLQQPIGIEAKTSIYPLKCCWYTNSPQFYPMRITVQTSLTCRIQTQNRLSGCRRGIPSALQQVWCHLFV